MTDDSSTPTQLYVDPASRSLASWRARLGVLASRGEVEGPRVEEARAALGYWQFRGQLDRAVVGGLISQSFAEQARRLYGVVRLQQVG